MNDDWLLETLGSIAEFRGGGTPSTENPNYWDGDIPWVSPKDMKSDEIGSSIDTITQEAIKNSAACLIPAGAVLIVVRSGILARTIPTALTICDLTVNQDIKALCPAKRLDTRYLHYFMRGAEKEILKLVTRGATVHRISTDSLKTFPILVPPIAEQKRIIAILDEAFAGIDTAIANAEANLASARELFDSYLNNAFLTGCNKWNTKSVGELCIIGDGNHSSKYPKSSEMVSEGVPFIRSTNIINGVLSWNHILYISKNKHQELKKGHLETGDVLFTNRGEIGKVAIVDESFNGANLNSQIAWLRCLQEMIPGYLFFFLQSGNMRTLFQQTKSGTALQQFTIGMLKEVPISFPPIDVQRDLVGKLSAVADKVEDLKGIYKRKLETLEDLKQTILKRAFAGKLPVSSAELNQVAAE